MKRVWLEELHRQWTAARGKRAAPSSRAFRRKWDELMTAAGLHSAEDRKVAQREAEEEEAKGHLKLHRMKARRNLILKIELPPAAEVWLLQLFDQQLPAECLQASLREVGKAASWTHRRFPELWQAWCHSVTTAFQAGKTQRPLDWRSPATVAALFDAIYQLTSLDWQEGALVREISAKIGLGSKGLEKRRRAVEACLSQMFNRQMPLQSLGIVLTDSRSDLSGILTLHYHNQPKQVFDQLKAVYSLSFSDLERAAYATTPATRVLTVENSKTTLRRLAASNIDGTTLLAACSFPTKALLRLLELLPRELPVFHFGDTDPAGFHILSKLRENSKRPVETLLMDVRPAKKPCPLGEYDRALLPKLLADPFLIDARAGLELMRDSGSKGDFEQETLGLPDLESWPFYSGATRKGLAP